jgi:serine/threonine protein phosphatase PrpC
MEDPREMGERLTGERTQVADRLIALANQRGGKDNITVVVADVER